MSVPPRRALLLGFDASFRARLSRALGEAWEAIGGNEATPVLALASSPHLVVVGAETGGLCLLAELRTDLSTSHLPVVVLTEEVDPETHAAAFRAGADAVVVLPIHSERFRAQAEGLVQTREALREQWSRQAALASRWETSDSEAARFLSRVREAAEAGMALPEFAVEDLARAVHLGPRQLARRLKGLTGETPGSLIRRLRMARAASLLGEGWAVGEVAEAVGFHSPSQFRRAYREAHGTRPSTRLPTAAS